eukprot:TRINITY_DN3362_c0_g1_i1.p1 TRINITY_DN3362_c0_g1~~TRINITY_DN3362_c0_g1_i1.p1  ORF type:complete len:721 (-),score=114.43 TRINITY_DN3362_c0_g1_i1:88-2250(-)
MRGRLCGVASRRSTNKSFTHQHSLTTVTPYAAPHHHTTFFTQSWASTRRASAAVGQIQFNSTLRPLTLQPRLYPQQQPLQQRNFCLPTTGQQSLLPQQEATEEDNMKKTATSTTDRLQKLRAILTTHNLDAYIVPTDDPHMSEYIAGRHKRREFISGFTGSSGTAVILTNPASGASGAALWTDGRYWLQTEHELDSNWVLMKDRLPTTLAIEAWLVSNLPSGGRVGLDATTTSASQAERYRKYFSDAGRGHVLVPDLVNLVDKVWEASGSIPAAPSGALMTHSIHFSGLHHLAKISAVRDHLKLKSADALVISALDEIMWLFNVRGSDIPYNPVALSYGLITDTVARFYVDSAKLTEEVRTHLGVEVDVLPYEQVFPDVKALAAENKRIWIDVRKSSEAVLQAAGNNLVKDPSPVELSKALKNPVELEGLRKCHLRDAVALISFLKWLEDRLKDGDTTLDEVSVSDKLEEFRSKQADFVSLSFDTIAGSGENGAIIHYKPEKATCSAVTQDKMFLVDSGGQYRDGTTDVTRTVHFGSPTAHEKRCFTRVLQGHIALATAVFPQGTTGSKLDVLARMHLWKDGLDYRHGTGHGVGAFLNVHEGPQGIGTRDPPNPTPLLPSMTITNEPGYYESGAFGIRIENVMAVKQVDTPHTFDGQLSFGFENHTFVPIQQSLIDTSLLSHEEKAYLNDYHKECREKVSPLIEDASVVAWIEKATQPIF